MATVSMASLTISEENRLGEGTDGIVYGVQTPKGSRYALKVNQPETPPEVIRQEATILKIVETVPHVLRCLGHFNLGPERIGMLMELLPVPDCFQALKKSRLTFAQVKEIAKQALETLDGLHSMKYIHGDIKPSNMSFDGSKLKIFDFAFATKIEKINHTLCRGTRVYQAPECLLMTRYDEKSDLWSLGATLFELYTGELLLPAERCEISELLYLLELNMGPIPPELIRLAPRRVRNFLDEEFELTDSMQQIKALGQRFGGMELWEARIYEAAGERGDDPEEVIELIKPMLSYTNRISAAEGLKNFEPTEKSFPEKRAFS